MNLVADITIMEEDSELVGWIEYGSKLPMITCCSRGWINCTETYYGDILDHISNRKSPHEMQGAILKSYYAKPGVSIPRTFSWYPLSAAQ